MRGVHHGVAGDLGALSPPAHHSGVALADTSAAATWEAIRTEDPLTGDQQRVPEACLEAAQPGTRDDDVAWRPCRHCGQPIALTLPLVPLMTDETHVAAVQAARAFEEELSARRAQLRGEGSPPVDDDTPVFPHRWRTPLPHEGVRE